MIAAAITSLAMILVAGVLPATAQTIPGPPLQWCAPCTLFQACDRGDGCVGAGMAGPTPPGGWMLEDAGQVNIQTAFFPSFPRHDDDFPFPTNLPHVIFFFTPGGVQQPYPERLRWDEVFIAYGRFPNHNTSIRLERLHDCGELDYSCTYVVKPDNGTPGDPPDYFAANLASEVGALSFALYPLIVGLIEDGNTPPEGDIHLRSDDLTFLATAILRDAEDDPIVNYVFDWGDGQRTETILNQATHTYAGPGAYRITVFFLDAGGAAGSENASAGTLLTPETHGPHTVQVGDMFEVDVRVRNDGLQTLQAGHNYGYHGGSPPSGTIQMVSNPGFIRNKIVAPGEAITGTYVFNALKAGEFTFAFGASAKPNGCSSCDTYSEYAHHRILIQEDPAPPVPPNDILVDDFESGDLDAWFQANTDGGDLSVSEDAAMVGEKGLAALVDDRRPLVLIDRTPQDEKRYRFGFWFDPSGYATPARARTHIVRLTTNAGDGGPIVFLTFRRRGSGPEITARVRRDDGSWAATDYVDLIDGPQLLELAWAAASAQDANDGYLTLWRGGTPLIHLPGQDNDEAGVDTVRLGVMHVPAGSAGVVAFDGVNSRRSDFGGL